MKRISFILLGLMLLLFTELSAQTVNQSSLLRPFEGHFYCAETGVHIHLNLYEEDIDIPNFSFLGKTHGYMSGNIYGTWMLVKHEINRQTATLRFSNDIGSDTQVIRFTMNPDQTYTYQALHGNVIRKAVGRKLVKTTGDMTFKRR